MVLGLFLNLKFFSKIPLKGLIFFIVFDMFGFPVCEVNTRPGGVFSIL
jgi:hypothetical protein